MREFMYDINSVLIAAILFVSMIVALEIGFRVGSLVPDSANEASKSHVNTIVGSLLGVLALLLGFTFSLALQRYDSRNAALVDESNAIGTTWLRAQLLAEPARGETERLLQQYVQVRVEAGQTTLVDLQSRENLIAEAKRLQSALWQQALNAIEADPRPVTSGLYTQSLNDMIDSLDTRDAALNRHVPEMVLMLLYATFLMSGSIVGYASGVAGHRASIITYIMIGLIVLLVFVIIDLDRPRRGLIAVSQDNLIELQRSMDDAQN